jgi:cytochrome c-type biogenesis protein CcmH/NrfG
VCGGRFQGGCNGVQSRFDTSEPGAEKGLKKETIVTAITAVVFLVVGFLAGYIFQAHQQASPQATGIVSAAGSPARAAQDPSGQAAPSSQGATMQGLPPGHPPLNIASTIKTLEDQAAQNPQDSEAALRLANLFYDSQRFQEAADWYEKALKLDPNNANAHTDLGTTYFSLGRAQDALAEYNKSLELDPRHEPTIYNTIIVNLEGTHDLAAARAAWKKLHAMNPNYKGLDLLKEKLDAAAGGTTKP